MHGGGDSRGRGVGAIDDGRCVRQADVSRTEEGTWRLPPFIHVLSRGGGEKQDGGDVA